MKKLSLIVALAVVLTIGGVFAAWQYPTGTIADASQGSIKVNISYEDVAGDVGSLQVVTAPSFVIDQEGTGDYDAVLEATKMTIGFTPKLGSVYTDKTDLKVYWKVEVTADPDGVFASKLATGEYTFVAAAGTAQRTYDVEASSFAKAGGIAIATANCPTKTEYDAYATKVGKVEITVTLSTQAFSS